MKVKHHHRIERMETGLKKKIIYKCIECPFVLNVPEQMIGRDSQCWGICGDTVTYTKDDFIQGLKHPMCMSCREERKKQKQLLSQIG